MSRSCPGPARVVAAVLFAAATAHAGEQPDLARIEDAYGDMNDALGAVGLIDSGYTVTHEGRDREAWSRDLESRRGEVRAGLAKLADEGLTAEDRRAAQVMRDAV
ncbi:MAG: hypothetical protein L0271_11425, partial [Gemmatimonadetes bacterium]|nr:hypothetical protein [Gemmatimonadota bacterium]